jgi:hypothetical protein
MRVKAVGIRSSETRAEVVFFAPDHSLPVGLSADVTRLPSAIGKKSMVPVYRFHQGINRAWGRISPFSGGQSNAKRVDMEPVGRQQHNKGIKCLTQPQQASVNAHGTPAPLSLGVEPFSTLLPLFHGQGGDRPLLRPGLALTRTTQDCHGKTALPGDNTKYKGNNHDARENNCKVGPKQ